MANCNTNFLSPSGFKLTVAGFKEIAFQCTNVTIPGISTGNATQATPFNDIAIVGDKLQYEDLEITFLIDEDFLNYSLIHNWLVGMTYPQKSTQWRDFVQEMTDKDFKRRYDDFIEQIDIYLDILNSNYNTTFKAHFVDAFPVSITPVEFSTELSDIQYLTATARFKYTYFKLLDSFDKPKTL